MITNNNDGKVKDTAKFNEFYAVQFTMEVKVPQATYNKVKTAYKKQRSGGRPKKK